jgi:DNA-binding beta-propeller fold protein YncE
LPLALAAQTPAHCDTPARDIITHVAVDGNPFSPIPSADGCYVFVTLAHPTRNSEGGVAVISRANGKVSVLGKFPLRDSPTGAVLTHDGQILIVTTGNGIEFLSAPNLISGHGGPELGYIGTGQLVGTIFANVTHDDQLLFVSAENSHAIIVIDLPKARGTGFHTNSIIGTIPTGAAPIALTFSSDETFLFTSSQVAPPDFNWPVACAPEAQNAATSPVNHPQGAIIAVNVKQAAVDPAHSIVSAVPAGCNPVRLALSADGNTVYTTVRGDNVLLAFNAMNIITDTVHARIARVGVGTSPVGIAIFDNGNRIVVTNSNRFGQDANKPQYLTVLDATRLASGDAAVLGTIPAGAFPRELRTTDDGKTLLVSNFLSKTVDVIDLTRVKLGAVRR